MLKTLSRVPLRQRNVREMQLDRHLWKDRATGHWHLEFAGDDLKIGSRGPEVNTYKVNLSTYRPEFIPILEEWLTVHRPKLPNATTSPFVFLTQRGNPHIQKTLHLDLSEAVAMRTGKRFYPHLVGPCGPPSTQGDARFPNGGHDAGRSAQDGDRRLLRGGT